MALRPVCDVGSNPAAEPTPTEEVLRLLYHSLAHPPPSRDPLWSLVLKTSEGQTQSLFPVTDGDLVCHGP